MTFFLLGTIKLQLRYLLIKSIKLKGEQLIELMVSLCLCGRHSEIKVAVS